MIKQSLLALAILLAPAAAHAQIRVESTGATVEEAKQRAFESAVQQGAGVLILKETEAINQEVVRNDIIAYSSGFVEKFEIKKQWSENGRVRLITDVWVSDSKISERLKSISRDGKNIDGRQIVARSQTLFQEQVSSDKIFKTIIKDYPTRAVEVQIGNVKSLDRSNTLISIEATLGWSESFLISLADALEKTSLNRQQDYETVISVRKKGFSWSGPTTATYADNSKLKILQNRLGQDQLAIKVVYLNSAKKAFAETCTDIQFYADDSPYFSTRKQEYSLLDHFTSSIRWPDLHFNGNFSEKVRFDIVKGTQSYSEWTTFLENINQMTASVVFRKDCI
jgi:hypothetical protein